MVTLPYFDKAKLRAQGEAVEAGAVPELHRPKTKVPALWNGSMDGSRLEAWFARQRAVAKAAARAAAGETAPDDSSESEGSECEIRSGTCGHMHDEVDLEPFE